jgi:hypothetical protein
MRILGSSTRLSCAGILCGLFLVPGAVQATTTTWTIQNGGLYSSAGGALVGDLTGSFAFDGTTYTSINMTLVDPLGGDLIQFTKTANIGPGSNADEMGASSDSSNQRGFTLFFLQPLTSAGGTVDINSTTSDYGDFSHGDFIAIWVFSGAYVTTTPIPEPSTAGLACLSVIGALGIASVRRRRREPIAKGQRAASKHAYRFGTPRHPRSGVFKHLY